MALDRCHTAMSSRVNNSLNGASVAGAAVRQGQGNNEGGPHPRTLQEARGDDKSGPGVRICLLSMAFLATPSGGPLLKERPDDSLQDRPRRSHWRRRPDRLRPAVPHRLGADVWPQRARAPAASRAGGGPAGPAWRRHGAGGLRLSAAGRRPGHARAQGRLRRRQLVPARRFGTAQEGHGARRVARHQRQDLHRPGPGHWRACRRRRAHLRGGQPLQHQLPHRHAQRRRRAQVPLLRHDRPGREPRPRPAGQACPGRRAGGDPSGGLGQPLGQAVSRLFQRPHRRQARHRRHRRPGLAQGHLRAHGAAARCPP